MSLKPKTPKARRGRDSIAAGDPIVISASPDMTSCELVRQFYLRCRRTINGRRACLSLDLKQVSEVDTKLMACLVAVYNLARASSVRLELAPSSSVLRMAEICRLGWLFDQTTPEQA